LQFRSEWLRAANILDCGCAAQIIIYLASQSKLVLCSVIIISFNSKKAS